MDSSSDGERIGAQRTADVEADISDTLQQDTSLRRVGIDIGPGYEVIIGKGLLSTCGQDIAATLGTDLAKVAPREPGTVAGDNRVAVSGNCRVAVVTDDTVEALYLPIVMESLGSAGFDACSFAFPHGEQSKNIGTYSDILEFFAQHQLTRTDVVVALGGGVVGDVTGFAASTYMRGVRLVQMPTTLLAAVDSSVGGKTAIDLRAGKNLAGAFWQPSRVICDYSTLDTLPEEIFVDGLAEALKTGMLCDRYLFTRLLADRHADIGGAIERCVEIKRDYVVSDEREAGLRHFLNLGHTFGHAIEMCSGYKVMHGHAVAPGLVMAARVSEALGIAEQGLAAEVERAIASCGLPVEPGYSAEQLCQAALVDKKRSGDRITLVLPMKIGVCVLHEVGIDELSHVFALAVGES